VKEPYVFAPGKDVTFAREEVRVGKDLEECARFGAGWVESKRPLTGFFCARAVDDQRKMEGRRVGGRHRRLSG
jgi:hypothetical protein